MRTKLSILGALIVAAVIVATAYLAVDTNTDPAEAQHNQHYALQADLERLTHRVEYLESVNPRPTATPRPRPTATPTRQPTATPKAAASSVRINNNPHCANITYRRDAYGDHRNSSRGKAPTWSLASDNLSNYSPETDHHVALKDAHISGACHWSSSKKKTFSQYRDNHNPTASSFNRSKSHRTPDKLTGIAKRVINTNLEKCTYATQHYRVKQKWNLSMTQSEYNTVSAWRNLCN